MNIMRVSKWSHKPQRLPVSAYTQLTGPIYLCGFRELLEPPTYHNGLHLIGMVPL